ncbi:hypothetical protein GSF04_02385 [Pseudoalteromonas sp. A22]|uniref:hypothetical protein n=1 Tax=Pseudoalteromonas sp. A22 TaxID=327511 RepID=UPI001BA611EB|nr:hypothetical protein [Pseudoalteromonas sp. A22]QUI61401.1 hypothetical protein GSF04_02385 [Pseudoalteromonas sp. A22]
MKLIAKYVALSLLAVFLVVIYFVSTAEKEVKKTAQNNETVPFISQSELIATLPDFYDMDVKLTDKENNKMLDLADTLSLTLKNSFGTKAMLDFEAELIELLKDPNISRKDKISILWNMVQQLGVESEQGLYVLEYMSTLAPIELSNELILLFESASERAKFGLLNVLETILLVNGEEAKVSAMHLSEVKQQLLDVISGQLANVEDPTLGFSILEAVVGHLPFEKAKLLIDDQFVISENKSNDVSNDAIRATKAGIYNRLALANPQSRTEFLPQYIETLNNEPLQKVERESLRQDLFNIIRIDEFMNEAPHEFKQTVNAFLARDLPVMDIDSAEFDYDAVKLYSDLSIAMAKLSASAQRSSESIYTQQINAAKSPLEQAILISRSPYQLNELLTDEFTRARISNDLRAEAKRIGADSAYADLLNDAASRL